MSKEDIYYEAMLARDARFDGKFFVGVKTTGIYCRPICPAKPKRKNVEFFPNHLAAERAGYRPCLRCRPESAPQSPAWIGKSAIARRAIKLITNQETIDFNEEEFAGLFGVSARHLRRVFVAEIGKTPKQLCFENRLNLARTLIVETALPITEIAFASGFSSVRRFNDAFKDRFKKNPSQIRRNKTSKEEGLKLYLPYRPPFDFEGLMHFYSSHKIGNLESFQNGQMIRVIEMAGKVGTVTISNCPARNSLIAEIDFPDTSMTHAIVARVRKLFDLDSDPVLIANVLEADPGMSSILQKHPGIRLPSGWDGYEVAVSAILGQAVTIEHSRVLVADLIFQLGKETKLEIEGKKVKLFPSPQVVADADLRKLKTTSARKQTLIDFSKALANRQISLEPTQDVEEFRSQVMAIRGIGPWSANYMALKILRDTDAFPQTDLILARALELHPQEVIEQMRPWRGYAATLFWREYSELLKKKNIKKPAKKTP